MRERLILSARPRLRLPRAPQLSVCLAALAAGLGATLESGPGLGALLGVGRAQAQSGFVFDAPQAPAREPAKSASAPAPGAAAVQPVELEGAGPDETALRYYAGQGHKARVETEIARLKRLHPYWRPPENLYEPVAPSGEDEQALWDLFGVDKMEDLKLAIAARERAEPGWKPSAELVRKMEGKILRLRILDLWRQGRLDDVIATVREQGMGDQNDVDLRWTIAEVNARMKKTADAVAIYRDILQTSNDTRDRLATIHKAMDNLRISDVEPLLALGRRDSAGRNEFEAIGPEITRARIAAFLHEERPQPVPDAEFRRFEDYARGVPDANQAGLVAWHHYKTKALRDALDWFKLALERGGDAMIAHGLAHSLRELGMTLEAEEVAYAWREPLINNAILFVDVVERELTRAVPPVMDPERLRRYAQVTLDLASGEGAQALGWYAYNTCQFEAAYEWFQRAVAWFPKETTVTGLALSARRTKRQKELFDLVNRYDGLFPKVVEIVFPDGYARPPSACDVIATAGAKRGAQAGTQGSIQAGLQAGMQAGMQGSLQAGLQSGAGALALPPPAATAGSAATRHPGWGAPMAPGAPGAFAGDMRAGFAGWGAQPLPPGQDRMPKFERNEFPAAADAENPLRFASSGKLAGRAAPGAQTLPAASAPFAPEPWAHGRQLVARRVPGVGAMPYERWGFALLPGGNGLQGPDTPHAAQKASAGTSWASEQASAPLNQIGGAGFEDPYRLAAYVAGVSRVPSPNALRSATPGWFRSAELGEEDEAPGAPIRPSFAGVETDPMPTGSIPQEHEQATPDAAAPDASPFAEEDEAHLRGALTDGGESEAAALGRRLAARAAALGARAATGGQAVSPAAPDAADGAARAQEKER
jgi:tetratricopeptide (TPR) repeat protein